MGVKAIGRGSLAAALSVLLDILRVLLWIVLGVSVVLAALSVYVYASAPADSVLGVQIERIDPWYVTLASFAVAIGGLAAALVVVVRLRRIFATLSAGDPFVPENAEHLRVIAVILAAYEIARLAASALLAGVAIGAGTDAAWALEVNLLMWFGVLSLFVLSEVFREGARLRSDQQLTI